MKAIIASGITAVLVLGGGSGFAYAAQLFSSPKQILENALAHASQNPTAVQNEEATFSLQINKLNANSTNPVVSAMMKQLNGMSLNGTMDLNASQKQMYSSLTFNDPSKQGHTAKLWLTSDRMIVDASNLQSLLNTFWSSMGSVTTPPQIPTYLVSDSSLSGGLSQFWDQVSNSKVTPEQRQASQTLLKIVIDGIPSAYISRPSLGTLEIKFNEGALKAIGDSEIHNIYQNKQEFIQALNNLQAKTGSRTTYNVTDFFRQNTEQASLNSFDSGLQSSPFTLDNTDIVLTKPLLGGKTGVHFQTSISLVPQQTNGVSGTFVFSEDETLNSVVAIQIPKADAQNSKTFTEFFNQP